MQGGLSRRALIGLAVAAGGLAAGGAHAQATQATSVRSMPISAELDGARLTLEAASPIQQALLAQALELQPADRLALLTIALNEGWKTYWRIPGRFGLTPLFNWSGSINLATAQVRFPVPILFAEGDDQSIGYQTTTILPVIVQARDATLPLSLSLDIELGLCSTLCLPARVQLAAEIDPADLSSPAANPTAGLAELAMLASALPSVDPHLETLLLRPVALQATDRFVMALPPDSALVRLIVLENAQGDHGHFLVDGGSGDLDFAWPYAVPPTQATLIIPGERETRYGLRWPETAN